MNARLLMAGLVLFGGAMLGCDAPDLPPVAVTPPAAAPAQPPQPAPEPVTMVAGAPGTKLPDDAPPVTDNPRPFSIHDPIKGRRSRIEGGQMGTIAWARFSAEYQLMMSSITEALNLYWAEHDYYPKTHEAFMKEIIDFNHINLPELPENEEYIYIADEPDPGKKLMVRLKQTKSKVGATAGAPAGQQPPPAADEQPAPGDIRGRAAAVGQQGDQAVGNAADAATSDHALAPGGLAPPGGLDPSGR